MDVSLEDLLKPIDKSQKMITPMESPHYPIENINEHGSPLLKERIQTVYNILKKEFNLETVQIWLYGSQLKGVSRSGHPDIDLFFYSPDVFKFDKIDIMKKIYKIRRDSPFALDLSFGDYNKPRTSNLYPEFIPEHS